MQVILTDVRTELHISRNDEEPFHLEPHKEEALTKIPHVVGYGAENPGVYVILSFPTLAALFQDFEKTQQQVLTLLDGKL